MGLLDPRGRGPLCRGLRLEPAVHPDVRAGGWRGRALVESLSENAPTIEPSTESVFFFFFRAPLCSGNRGSFPETSVNPNHPFRVRRVSDKPMELGKAFLLQIVGIVQSCLEPGSLLFGPGPASTETARRPKVHHGYLKNVCYGFPTRAWYLKKPCCKSFIGFLSNVLRFHLLVSPDVSASQRLGLQRHGLPRLRVSAPVHALGRSPQLLAPWPKNNVFLFHFSEPYRVRPKHQFRLSFFW